MLLLSCLSSNGIAHPLASLHDVVISALHDLTMVEDVCSGVGHEVLT